MRERQVIPVSWYVSCGILSLLAIILTQVPLFNVLGYESAFALGLLTTIVSWFWGLRQQRSHDRLTRTLVLGLAQHIPPLIILSLNAFIVQNCNFSHGLIFYAALPLMSALYVALLAYVASEACTRFECSKPLRRLVLITIFCLPLAAELHQFLTEPTIFFFNHAWGWYAGSIYDEGLIPDGRLGFFRLGTVIRSLALLVVLQMLRKLTARAAPLISVVIIIAWFGESKLAIEGHYYVDRDQIETILSERVELDGLVLHLDPSISEPRRQRIIVEHAYRLEQLARLHQGLDPQPPIHSYVYRDAEQKGALMGGKRTMFAKPWLREIHIHGYRVPHRILGHELVHALLEPHADHPLGIPVANGVIPLMAWVEGFAEAFTPPRSAYDIHTNARWLQERGRLPALQPLLSPLDVLANLAWCGVSSDGVLHRLSVQALR